MQNDHSVTNGIITVQNQNELQEQDTQSNLHANIAEYSQIADKAFSKATKAARKNDLTCFTTFCIDNGLQSLPATPSTIISYLECLDSKGIAPSTMERRLQSINHLHKAADCEYSPCSSQKVRLTIRAIKRRLAETNEKRGRGQAKPATYDLIQRLLDACNAAALKANESTKLGHRKKYAAIRDKAMIAVAYAAFLRRSEIVALDVSDITVKNSGAAIVNIRRSKTDQLGHGQSVGIGFDTVAALKEYLTYSNHKDGALFLSANGNRLTSQMLGLAIKQRAVEAGLSDIELQGLSAHSTRVGAAVDGVSVGQSTQQMQRAGRWKGSQMVARYAQNVDIERDIIQRERLVRSYYK